MIKIVLIGAGNVATHLGMALKNAGKKIVQVYSRTDKSASLLAKKLDTDFTINFSEINPNADLYVVAVSDDVVPQILDHLSLKDKLIVHTSGFLSMDILKQSSDNYGVFYLLQTFSKTRNVDMKTVPVCIETNTFENLEKLKSLAQLISTDIREITSEQRKRIHLAAVFACNFPNLMYTIAEKLLEDSNLDFDILKPLILETAAKVQVIKPKEAQTGPATRGDEKVIEAHLELLKNYPTYKNLYQILSNEIKTHNQ